MRFRSLPTFYPHASIYQYPNITSCFNVHVTYEAHYTFHMVLYNFIVISSIKFFWNEKQQYIADYNTKFCFNMWTTIANNFLYKTIATRKF